MMLASAQLHNGVSFVTCTEGLGGCLFKSAKDLLQQQQQQQ
jgi:hypothetical protein